VTEISVTRSLEIGASLARVWEVLTRPEWTSQWAAEFGAAGPIESTWESGSPVRWRNAKGDVYVEGHVTEVVPGQLLRFTVRDVANPRLRPSSGRAEDEITQSYRLAGAGDRTVLSTTHGDFAKIADGETLYPLVGELWDRLLPTIKELAESGQRAPR
jgi:uncharacterized protein YndB with AHSA1/START domain